MERFVEDFRHGIRTLRRAPAFTLASVLILALGIGTGTAVFTGFQAIVIETLPVSDPDRLVTLSLQRKPTGSVPLVAEGIDALRRQSRTLQDAAGVATSGAVAIPLTEGDRSLVLDVARVTANFFQVLGARPVLGRLLRPEDGADGAALVTVISHATWQREFGGDPAVLGRRLTQTTYQESYSIVGVAPPGLDYPVGADYWIPAGSGGAMNVVARLAPGVTSETARGEFLTVARAIDGRRSNPRSPTAATIQPLSEAVLGDAKPILVAITAAVALLLLIACVNVGNLLLMRATQRARDITVRRALGATSGDVARLFLVEGAMLGAAGGALGLAFAVGLLQVLPTFAQARLPRTEMIGLADIPVAIAIAVSALAVLIFGVAPAVAAARGDLASELRIDGRSGTGTRRRRRVSRLLVAAQVALAVILLFGAGLLVRSLVQLTQLDPGYETEGVAIVELGFNRVAREGPSMSGFLLSGFGLAALLVAAVGLYGVMSLAVRERTHELGVRKALGASAPRLRQDILGNALTVTLAGTVAGLGAALLLSRLLVALLFEVGPADPVTLLGVCAALLAVAVVAAYLPARRATRVDAMRALRTK